MPRSTKNTLKALGRGALAFDRALADTSGARFVLRLYVSGMTPRSTRAIDNIQRLCEEHLAGRYELQIIDIYQQPELAREQQIIAAPTLVKKLPLPLRKFVGEMSDPGRILLGLGVEPKGGPR
ncbi:MAG: circadian clock KaiB family protein [Verrucomicrobiota bacterium]